MKRIILSITILLLQIHAISLHAQGIAKNYKADNNNNPISASVFCADPTALDYNGRLYVYGSNDHQQFIKNNKKDGNGYGDIKSLVVLSTDDMVNWTFHGTIDVQKICSTWKVAGGQWYKGFMNSWAPSVTWRTTEDGKEEFFLYFANTSHGVGVLKADSPVGPWTSPLNHSMINRDTPGVLPCSWIFDPGVVIDENGTGWISFGGGDPNEQGTTLQPNNALFAKLDASMTALDGKPARIPAPYHFEASELNIMNGKFVYTYCSSWAERKDAEWNAYKQEHNLKIGKPNTCTMCYMVSDDPMNPDSWEYKGVCGKHPGFPSPNNHSHLHKFQGNYYYLYHWAPLMKSMLDGKAIDSSCDGYRSICVNLATVDEETQKISSVNQNLTGVTAIKNLNPYDLQQAETTANSGGVMYEDYKNIEKDTKISALGNDASRNLQVAMKAGAWTMVRNADFGEEGAQSFKFIAQGTGTLEIRLDKKTAEPAATIDFSSTSMEEHDTNIDPTPFKGVHDVYFVFTAADKVQFDAWQFSAEQTTGIQQVVPTQSSDSKLYDLSGRLINNNASKGIVIEQTTDENGKKQSRKVIR